MTNISFIPDDLIFDIILKLPVKYVIVCRSVCKKWNSMLRSSNFISLYDNHNHRTYRKKNDKEGGSSFILLRFDSEIFETICHYVLPHQFPDVLISFLNVKRNCNELIATIDGEEKVDVPFSSPPNIGKYYFRHSFRLKNVYDGIICLSNEIDILLVNPSTRESQRLPLSSFSYPCPDATDSYVLGVWFDDDQYQSNSNQPPPGGVLQHYKVFRAVNLYIRYNYRDRGFEDVKLVFEIYDSRENCWRKSKTMYEDYSSWYHLLFNGVFHLSIDGDSLITLDARSEILGRLPLPSGMNRSTLLNAPLFNLRGSLALLKQNNETLVPYCLTDIWLMKEYGVKQSWTKQYTIKFDVPLQQHLCKPITFWKYMDKEEEEEDELFLQNHDGKLISINLVTNKITNFELYGIPSSMMIVPYIETLLTLK